MADTNYIDGRSAEEIVFTLWRWMKGNGALGAEDRIRSLEGKQKEMLTKTDIKPIVHEVIREQNHYKWPLYVSIALLIVNSVAVFFTIFGGTGG